MESRLAIKDREVTPLEKDIGKIVHEFANQSAQTKDKFKNIKIAAAKELTIKEDGRDAQKGILIQVPFTSLADT